MEISVVDRVVDFHYEIFDRIFATPFRSRVEDRLRRDAVVRQVQDSAGAASQSLTRLFANERLAGAQAVALLAGLKPLVEGLVLDDISSASETPESLVKRISTSADSAGSEGDGHDTLFRVALHAVVQVLMLVGPVMAEWQKLGFSSTFELPRRVVHRLNQISEQLGAIASPGQAAADERYELSYRDYLLQRFYRVEAGTVRMTTNLDVDLRELFVMPRVQPVSSRNEASKGEVDEADSLMDLAAAREIFGGNELEPRVAQRPSESGEVVQDGATSALDQVRRQSRNVIVGPPGSGKSTFFEWLQVKLAAVEEELVAGGQQAIPLLLRVRQLNARDLPSGDALVAAATANSDLAALMPAGWLERQMREGRVLLMLDGLDETEPELRDSQILPWLSGLCGRYPTCRYLVSSRPVGYPPGALRALGFEELELVDFDDEQVGTYARHWCVAVRLARNEPEEQARREGAADGSSIVEGFRQHGYIRTLARNPLMLSAICLVNYFESGVLPKDRALLYRLCVEGLLHHWDQRRGIRSAFTLQDKLRACREVALAMQVDDRAEYEAGKVRAVFEDVLGDGAAAEALVEHIRRRSGLLLERRAGAFAFAHLTFQEYLAARAIHEGNQLSVDVRQLVREHKDARWQEVIPLFCGSATTVVAREMVEALVEEVGPAGGGVVLAEAYLSSGPELSRDVSLRTRVIGRIAGCGWQASLGSPLSRFADDEVAPIANRVVGTVDVIGDLSEAYNWLYMHPTRADWKVLWDRLAGWRDKTAFQITELIHLLHIGAPGSVLSRVARDTELYRAPGPTFTRLGYRTQAEVALLGLLSHRTRGKAGGASNAIDGALLTSLRVISANPGETIVRIFAYRDLEEVRKLPSDGTLRSECAVLLRGLAEAVNKLRGSKDRSRAAKLLVSWADALSGVGGEHRPAPGRQPPGDSRRRKERRKRR